MNGFPRETRNEVRNFARFRLSWKAPLTRPSATLSPSEGEREGVRGRFMESPLSFFRMHWDHEPDWHPSPCPLPARRGEGWGEGAVHGECRRNDPIFSEKLYETS